MVARVNKLPWQQDESHLRHRKLKFGIQILLDLRK